MTDTTKKAGPIVPPPTSMDNLDVETLLAKGDEAFLAKDLRQALTYYRKALDKEPDNIRCLRKAGTTFYKLREWPEAVSCFEKAVAQQPKEKDLLFSLGLVFVRSGNRTQALAVYDRLKKVHVDKAEEFFKIIYE